jgi:hypothetical protein
MHVSSQYFTAVAFLSLHQWKMMYLNRDQLPMIMIMGQLTCSASKGSLLCHFLGPEWAYFPKIFITAGDPRFYLNDYHNIRHVRFQIFPMMTILIMLFWVESIPHHNIMRILLGWQSCCLLVPLTTTSAECRLNITSRWSVSRRGSSPVFFSPLRMIWLWEHQLFTAFPASAGKCTLDKLDARLRQGLMNITNTFACIIPRSLLWPNSINLGHGIRLQNTTVLVKKTRHMDWILKDTTETELHPDNVNREDSFLLSQAWKLLICDLRGQRQPHTEASAPSTGPWKGPTTSILLSPHHHHLPTPFCCLLGVSSLVWLSFCLTGPFSSDFPSYNPTYMVPHNTSSKLPPWR